MTKKADIGSKRLISLDPNNWVSWITESSDLVVTEFLNPDFQWISKESDVLIKVQSQNEGELLILNELQIRYHSKMPQRIRAYAALAEERYNLPVYPVLINILPRSASQNIPNCYHSEIRGITAHQDYRVINLWEVNANLVFERHLTSLLPFVPILKGGNEPPVIRQALRELQNDENLNELEPLLSFFASFVLEIPLIQQIMRWDMTVLRQSPWYEEILKEGSQQGLQQGLQQGELIIIIKLLNNRLGSLPSDIQQQITNLSTSQLEKLSDQILHFTNQNELKQWLIHEN